MKRTLYTKFFVLYFVLAIVSFLIISTLGSDMIEKEVEYRVGYQLYQEATSISQSQGKSYFKHQLELPELYNALSALGDYQNAQVWLLDTKGKIILNTARANDSSSSETLNDFDPTLTFEGYYRIGNFYGYFPKKTLSVMVPVLGNLKTHGFIAIHYPLEQLAIEKEAYLKYVYILGLLIYLLSFFVLLLFSTLVYKPLQKIITGANEYASGNLEYSIDVRGNDEIGQLSATLNYMSDKLKESEDYQKTFISNVSHDFRSPLTSIKGYTQALLDGTIPVDMQEKYLNIILFETNRLNKLTAGLLTLNNINEKGRLLDISSFPLNQTIKNTAATFEGICREKQIYIELIFPKEELFVKADIVKIQQVLYNLIDNAIKFSNKESSIKIELTKKYESVFVSVKDFGIGIPKENLNKIWERFYKIDGSRGKDRQGTGLGLAIVKEIIQAHNQNINVISTPGVGTEFIFTLPLAN